MRKPSPEPSPSSAPSKLRLAVVCSAFAAAAISTPTGTSLASTDESVQVVDQNGQVGTHTSMQLDANGFPVVSYHDVVDQNLKILRCNDPVCAPGGDSITSPDTVGQVGRFTSLELDSNGFPVVSYHDSTSNSLKLLHCNDPNCAGGDESIAIVDDSARVGEYTSLALDSNGRPVIAYLSRSSGSSLRIARCNDPNCAGGDESITDPDAAGTVGLYTSIQLGGGNRPVVSYFDRTNGDLKLLRCDDPLCAGTETTNVVDRVGLVGQWTSLVLDQFGRPVISYHDASSGDLKLARCNDVACAGGNESITVLDSEGLVGEYTSLVLDGAGRPVVAYYDMTNGSLKIARCSTSSCSGGVTTTRPDTANRRGLYASLELNASGHPTVSYFDSSKSDLIVLSCNDAACSDTGDVVGPRATVRLATGQASSVKNPPVSFAVDFDEPVVGFEIDDIVFSGTAGATRGVLTGSGDSFVVTVNTVTSNGTIRVDVKPGAVRDDSGNPSTTQIAGNTVTVTGQPSEPDFVPLNPARLLDTRPGFDTIDGKFAGGGRVSADGTIAVRVGGRAGVSASARAVALNVTALEAGGPSFVTVYPCDQPRPVASNLNLFPGQFVPNSVISRLSANGDVCLYSLGGGHLVVDVAGFFPTGSTYRATNPRRLLETRPTEPTFDGVSQGGGRRSSGQTTVVKIAGRGGVPTNATAAVLNVTLTETAGPGFATLYPCDQPRPLASNINTLVPGSTIANNAVVKLSGAGTVCIYTRMSTHLILDVSGWFTASSSLVPLTPARLLETRESQSTVDGRYEEVGVLPSGTITVLDVAGRGGSPTPLDAVILNVTVTEASGPGFITVYPCSAKRPNASNLNYVMGSTVANLVIAAVDPVGTVCIYNHTATQLVVDVSGGFRG